MKKLSVIAALSILALVAMPATGSATIVFSALADISIYDAPCGGGFLKAVEGTHSGTVHSFAPGDVGRPFRVNGQNGFCGFGTTAVTCGANTTVTSSGGGATCYTYQEVSSNQCSFNSWEARTLVEVTDSGSESATAASSCTGC